MIALVGAHGTGKTTLLQALKKVRPEIIISDGFSRPVFQYINEIDSKLTGKEAQLLINRISDKNWPIFSQIPNLALTRTPIDHYSYSALLGYDDLAEERLELLKSTDLTKIKFFYIPIEFEIENDGVRYTDKKFQSDFDVKLVETMEGCNIVPTAVLTGTVEHRLNEILKHI